MHDEFETVVIDSPDESGIESDVLSIVEETQVDGEPEGSFEDEIPEIIPEDVSENESESEIEIESELESIENIPENEFEPDVEETYSTYFGHRVYYNSAGYPYYFDEDGKRQYISDIENIVGPGEESPEESTGDMFDDVVVGDSEAIVLAINQQTEVIQNGDIAVCIALGLLVGVVFVHGFRLRRI